MLRKNGQLTVEDKQKLMWHACILLPVWKNSWYNSLLPVSLDLKMLLWAVWSAAGSAKLIMSSWCSMWMCWFNSFSNIFTSSGEVFYMKKSNAQHIKALKEGYKSTTSYFNNNSFICNGTTCLHTGTYQRKTSCTLINPICTKHF